MTTPDPAPASGRWVALPPTIAVTLVLVALAPRYGPHGDELYVRLLRPGWWYADQPPLTVWITHAMDVIAPGIWWAQRIPAAFAAGAGAFVAAAIPRTLGHDLRCQRLAAWSCTFTVYPLLVGHVLLTATFDLLAWNLVVLQVVRAVCGRPRALAWAGAIAGIACWNKLLILVLVAALALALVLCNRRLARSRQAAAGCLLLLLVGGFQLGAQLAHGLPMSEVSADLIARQGDLVRWLVPPLIVVFVGPPLVLVCWRGLVDPWRGGDARLRFLAAMALLVLAWNVAVPAQPYYAAAAFLPALAAGWGSVPMVSGRGAVRLVASNAAVAVVICLPVLPSGAAAAVSRVNPMIGDQLGFPEAVRRLAALRERAGPDAVAVVTDHYSLAGAVALYGPPLGLGKVASGHNGLWAMGPPSTDHVLVVGPRSAARAPELFRHCERIGELPILGHPTAGGPVLSCRGPRGGWPAVWPRLRHLGG